MDRRAVLTGSIGALTLAAGCLRPGSGGPASDATFTTATSKSARTATGSGGTEPDRGTDSPPNADPPIRLRYGYYPDDEELWVHHDGGTWLYADRSDRLRAVGEGGPWTVFGPGGPYLLFAVAATQRVSGVPPGAELELVAVRGDDGTEQVVDTVTAPTEKQPVPSAPADAPTNGVTFDYGVAADRTTLTVTHDGGPDVVADRLAVHVAGRTTAWEAADGTVSEGDAQTVPLESGDRFVKVTWRPEGGWVRLAGNHILG